MSGATRDIRVFVSSTSKDLVDYRAVARNVILDLDWHPKMMEHFGAHTGPTVGACRKLVEECDLLLLIVGWKRGWVPTNEEDGNGIESVTALELAHAREKDIPVLAMLASEMWPGSQWEDEPEARQWVKDFRSSLNQIAVFFEYEAPTAREAERLPGFRAKVKEALLAQKQRLIKEAVGGTAAGVGLDFFDSARKGLIEGTGIPVLGSGVFGSGPLSAPALAEAILKDAPSVDTLKGEDLSLATASEYWERYSGSRESFLKRFRAALEEQTAQVGDVPVIDLLCQIDEVPLIVYESYDRLLEERLAAAGRRYVVVAHVLRSFDGENDGRLLVLRPDGEPDICRADELRVDRDESVLYRPQGSPYLHDDLDPDLELDTVVVTESDHAAFLRRLENPETGVPARLGRKFLRSPLLFLGYAMDAWQYRLMMQLFQSAGRHARRASTVAIRVPESPIEQVAWKRLNADVIRMSPDEFAQRVLNLA